MELLSGTVAFYIVVETQSGWTTQANMDEACPTHVMKAFDSSMETALLLCVRLKLPQGKHHVDSEQRWTKAALTLAQDSVGNDL